MHYRHTIQRTALVLACVVVLGGCSTVKGWFSSKEEKAAAKPTELVDITPSVTVSKMWSVDAGDGEGKTGVRQGPAVADGHVYVAAIDGGVRSFDLQTGAAITSAPTLPFHFSVPLAASSTMTSPSRPPTATRPPPAPGPPDRRTRGLSSTSAGS